MDKNKIQSVVKAKNAGVRNIAGENKTLSVAAVVDRLLRVKTGLKSLIMEVIFCQLVLVAVI